MRRTDSDDFGCVEALTEDRLRSEINIAHEAYVPATGWRLQGEVLLPWAATPESAPIDIGGSVVAGHDGAYDWKGLQCTQCDRAVAGLP